MAEELEENEFKWGGITKAERLQEEQNEQDFQEEKFVDSGRLGLEILNLPALKSIEEMFVDLRVKDPVGQIAPVKFVNIETLTIPNWKKRFPKTKKNLHKDWCFDPKGSLEVKKYKGTRFAIFTITIITPFNYNGDNGIPDENLTIDSSMFYAEQSENNKKEIKDAQRKKEVYRIKQTKKHQNRVNTDNFKDE